MVGNCFTHVISFWRLLHAFDVILATCSRIVATFHAFYVIWATFSIHPPSSPRAFRGLDCTTTVPRQLSGGWWYPHLKPLSYVTVVSGLSRHPTIVPKRWGDSGDITPGHPNGG